MKIFALILSIIALVTNIVNLMLSLLWRPHHEQSDETED